MAKDKQDELKCICGGKPSVKEKGAVGSGFGVQYIESKNFWVKCKCGIQTKPCKTKAQAFKIWNEWR